MKTCSKCGVTKVLDEFYPDKSKRDGRHSVCKECAKADRKSRYAENPDKILQRNKQWIEKNPTYLSDKRRRDKQEMIEAYGGRCACCGEDEYEFLTLDHVNGDGAEHRKVIGEGVGAIHRYLKRNSWPQDAFRLLCWNCNCSRGIYGFCPHTTKAA